MERSHLRNLIQRIHPEDREGVESAVRRAVADRAITLRKYRVVLPDNTQRWVAARGRVCPDTQGKPVRMMGATTDITARKQAEEKAQRQHEELAHLSRVTTVSELSGSLAHELNQPLAIILTNAQAAQACSAQEPPDLVEAREILADIVSEDQRAGEVIRRLRSLLKHGDTSLQPVAVNGIVEEVLPALAQQSHRARHRRSTATWLRTCRKFRATTSSSSKWCSI